MQVRRSRFAATAESLRRGAVVVVEHATQSLAPPDCSALASMLFVRNDQSVAETLVISFTMIMLNEILNPFASAGVASRFPEGRPHRRVTRPRLLNNGAAKIGKRRIGGVSRRQSVLFEDAEQTETPKAATLARTRALFR
jgi:hypothetical protein